MYTYLEKSAEMTFVQKTRVYNVNEIDTYSGRKVPKNDHVLFERPKQMNFKIIYSSSYQISKLSYSMNAKFLV